jgi:hypothetical protein
METECNIKIPVQSILELINSSSLFAIMLIGGFTIVGIVAV